MLTSRRTFLAAGAGAIGHAAFGQTAVPEAIRKLKPMTDGVKPITDAERHARIDKARRLMREQKIGALFMERGSSMFYFTGTRQVASLIIPLTGELAWIVPSADEPRAHEAIRLGGDIIPFAESDGLFRG